MEKIETLNKQNINELKDKLLKRGFTLEQADEQLSKLHDLILLSALKRLAKGKNINLSDVKFSTGDSGATWLNDNFSDQEIADATFEALESTLTQYLKILGD